MDLATNESDEDVNNERYKQVGSSSSIGRDEIEFLSISYDKDSFIRYIPTISLRDLDDAMFLPILNKSLAEKVKAIHVFSNGYKIQEIQTEDFLIDETNFNDNIPVKFKMEELEDQWVRIRPREISSSFHIRFFDKTPKRLFIPEQVENSLEKRNK